MAEDKEKQTDEGGATAAAEGSSSKGLFLGILGGIVLVNAIVAYFLVSATMKQVTPQEEVAADTAGPVASGTEATGVYADSTLEAIVNISGTDGMRFLKVAMVIEYDAEEYKNLGAELNKRHVVLKNMLIDMLSSMTLEELQAENARKVIRTRFLSKVNTMLPEKEAGKVSNVYLTEFIIQ
jgi:flagellar basal body-associated protein FliL